MAFLNIISTYKPVLLSLIDFLCIYLIHVINLFSVILVIPHNVLYQSILKDKTLLVKAFSLSEINYIGEVGHCVLHLRVSGSHGKNLSLLFWHDIHSQSVMAEKSPSH